MNALKIFSQLVLLFIVTTCNNKSVDQKLFEIESETIAYLKDKGFNLFKNSSCYDKKFEYVNIPVLLVSPVKQITEIELKNSQTLLKSLKFKFETRKEFYSQVSWQFYNTRNKHLAGSSSYKKFFCSDQYLSLRTALSNFSGLDLDNISYSFQIYQTSGFIHFLVDKEQKVFVFDSKSETIFTLQIFREMVENNEIYFFW